MSGATDGSATRASLVGAVLLAALLAAAVLLAALLAGCGAERTPEPLSILVVTLDTTRADALGCYGSRRAVSPQLDALAAESLLFEDAHTVAPITLPAHASLFTGLYPPRHAVRNNGLWPLSEEARTLAELARERGYQTGAVVASVVLDPAFGLDQGFETYLAAGLRQESAVYEALPAREVVDRALGWLAARDAHRPFFLWMHLYDPHAPYDPPPEFRAGRTGSELYYGEIASMDRELGRLLAQLRTDGTLGHTALLVTADHGEALGEHGEWTHGAYCYETTLRIPLLVRFPDGSRAGRREPGLVSLVDVYPTLAEAMGIAPAELGDLDGVSLWQRAPPEGRGIYCEAYMGALAYGWSPLAGWIENEKKVLHCATPQAFDLRADPGEEHDLVAAGTFALEPYLRAIGALAARPAHHPRPFAQLDDTLLRGLAALGYGSAGAPAASVPHPLAETGRPCPMDRIDEHATLLQAIDWIQAGEDARAVPLLESVLEQTPQSFYALEQLSAALLRLGRPGEALPLLVRLTREAPVKAPGFQNLAAAYDALGRFDEAVEALRITLALAPDNAVSLQGMARLLENTGHAQEAETYRARLRAR